MAMTMTPQVTSWGDLTFISEEVDPESKEFQYTAFGLLDNEEKLYYGQLNVSKKDISLDDLSAALSRVPDEAIFPPWPQPGANFRKAPDPLPANMSIKRPTLEHYPLVKRLEIENQLCESLMAEAQLLQELSEHPHPNLIGYHGCRVVRGHIIGLVLDKHPHDLETYVTDGLGQIDKVAFMAALESVVQHLHGLGWAHNDLTPFSIMVSEAGMPVLFDFSGCQKVGTKLKYIRGTKGWIQGEIEDHTVSDVQHDFFALGMIRDWLDGKGQ